MSCCRWTQCSNRFNSPIGHREYKDYRDSYNLRCDKDYYNDLPGKVPPDLLGDNELSQASGGGAGGVGSRAIQPAHLNIRVSFVSLARGDFLFNSDN